MDIGTVASIVEAITRLLRELWRWRRYIPLGILCGFVAYLMIENRRITLEKAASEAALHQENIRTYKELNKQKDQNIELLQESTRREQESNKALNEAYQQLFNNRRQ